MKIISKFSDYYDIGLAYGVDEKLRFVRETLAVDVCTVYGSPTSYSYVKYGEKRRITFYFDKIGFCGKIYPLISISIEKCVTKNKVIQYFLKENTHCYDIDDFEQYCKINFISSHNIKYDTRWIDNHRREQSLYSKMKDFYDATYLQSIQLFEKYKTPCFLIQHHRVTKEKHVSTEVKTILLPQLKTYKFSKAVAPMQAFQEISMYLGQLDLAEDNTVTIEDKYLAQGKGFDCYSFKKMPTKHKRKKC